MTQRTLQLVVQPGPAISAGLASSSTFPVDLTRLAAAGAKELSQNAPPLLGVAAMLDGLLDPGDPEFRWAGPGPGVGREIRRTTSGMLGRFMARWFAHEHLGIAECLAIDGNEVELPCIGPTRFRAVRVPGADGDLPDWAWVSLPGQNPVVGLLEAKATYYRHKLRQTMDGAASQLARMEIQMARPRRRWQRVAQKRWAVGSGWATGDSIPYGFPNPVLRVDDPEEDGVKPNDDEARQLLLGMVRWQLSASLEGLGFTQLPHRLRSGLSASPDRAPLVTVAIEAGLWRVAVPDRGEIEVLGSLLPRPGAISEAHSVLVGYPRDFVEGVISPDGKQPNKFDPLPLLVSRNKATRLSGDQLTS